MKKVTSYNLKKTNSKLLSEKSMLAGYSSTSLYMDKLMDIYLSDNGFLVNLSDESAALLKGLIDKHERTAGFLLEKMIKKFCGEVSTVANNTTVETTTAKGGMDKAKRSPPKKAASYPSNLNEQFEILWDTKGKKGAKNGTRGAYEIFKKLAANVDDATCEAFTRLLVDDINKNSGECGYPEMHLTSYLNQQRWDK